jgi:nitrogen fixation/metabolism regulation signal transduction histidine kinase
VNISTRLMLGLGLVVVLLVLLGTAGQVALGGMAAAVDALQQRDYTGVEAATELAWAADQRHAAAFVAVLGDTTGYAAKREAEAAALYARAREAEGKAVDVSTSQGEALRNVDDAKRRYDEALARLQAAPRGTDAVNLYYAVVEPEFARLSTSIEHLQQQQRARGTDVGADAVRTAWRTRAWVGVITAFVFAALIWTTTHLYRMVVWPLMDMARTARAITNGEANRRFQVSGHDELGALATLLNSLADRLFAKEREAAQLAGIHEQLLESVLDRWRDGLAVVDSTGRVVAANAAFRNVLRAVDKAAAEWRLDELPEARRERLVFRGRRELGELIRLLPPRATLPDVASEA